MSTQTCARCAKPSYAAESIDVDGARYHRNCFKCAECGTKLSSATFSTVDGTLYCRNHALAKTVRVRPNFGADAMEISTYTARQSARSTDANGAAMRTNGDVVKSTATATMSTATATTVEANEASKKVSALLARVRCERCEKSAYPMESVDVDGKRWHKGCFKCFECGTSLSLSTFVTCDGEAYCAKDGLARQRSAKKSEAEKTETREENPLSVVNPELLAKSVGESEAVPVDEPPVEDPLSAVNPELLAKSVGESEAVPVDEPPVEDPLSAVNPELLAKSVGESEAVPVDEPPVEDPLSVVNPELLAKSVGESASEPTTEVVEVTAEVEAVTLEAPETKKTEEETSEPSKSSNDASAPVEDVPATTTIDETIPKPRANGGANGGGRGGGRKKKKGKGGRK